MNDDARRADIACNNAANRAGRPRRHLYPNARSTRTAWDGHQEGNGVCRDFAHVSIALCRCMNIPARYCTGYLGDIGVSPVPDPMDFSAWFEVLLEDGLVHVRRET
jgi:transglutaminase-like putative cysteine protease